MTERNYDYSLYAKFLHMGLAVFAHSIVGKLVWQRMWSFKRKRPNE